MAFSIRASLLIGISLATSACTSLPGAGVATIPKKPFEDNSMAVIANKYLDATSQNDDDMPVAKPGSWLEFQQECRDHVVSGDAGELKKCRNFRDMVISDMMLVINNNSHSYEGTLLAGRAQADFYIGTARTAFETAATLVDATGVKTVLSALATFTGSTQNLSTEAFYYEQTGPALITAMRAARTNAYLRILAGMKSEYKDYPLASAIDDLQAYFRAGTMANAVIELTKATARSEIEADEKTLCAKTEAQNAQEVLSC